MVDIGVRFALSSVIANQPLEFMKILPCDWLQQKVRPNVDRCRKSEAGGLSNFSRKVGTWAVGDLPWEGFSLWELRLEPSEPQSESIINPFWEARVPKLNDSSKTPRVTFLLIQMFTPLKFRAWTKLGHCCANIEMTHFSIFNQVRTCWYKELTLTLSDVMFTGSPSQIPREHIMGLSLPCPRRLTFDNKKRDTIPQTSLYIST